MRRDSSIFCKRINKIQGSSMQPMKTLKPFEHTWPLRKQPSNLWMLLARLRNTLTIFYFQKTLWLDNILWSAPVQVAARTLNCPAKKKKTLIMKEMFRPSSQDAL